MADEFAGVTTMMSTVPWLLGGEKVVMVVGEVTVKGTAVRPKYTAVAPSKLVPVTVTAVPPAPGPLVGLTEVTVGV